MNSRNLKMPVSILAIMLSIALIVSCRPAIEPDNPNQGTGEVTTIELAPVPITEEPTHAEPSPTPITEEPSQPVTEEPSSEELPIIDSYEDLQKLVGMDPAKVDNSNLPITPVEALHTTTPERVDVDMANYTLVVDGLVANPLELTYTDIMAYPQISEVVLLICPSFFADNAEWTGVPVTTLLTEAEIMPDATMVTFYGLDISYETYYRQTLPLATVYQDGVFLAYQVNGEKLPPEHGYPVRLVVKGSKGFNWVKWLWRIEVS